PGLCALCPNESHEGHDGGSANHDGSQLDNVEQPPSPTMLNTARVATVLLARPNPAVAMRGFIGSAPWAEEPPARRPHRPGPQAALPARRAWPARTFDSPTWLRAWQAPPDMRPAHRRSCPRKPGYRRADRHRSPQTLRRSWHPAFSVPRRIASRRAAPG